MADRQDGAEGTAEGVNGQKRVRGGKKGRKLRRAADER